MTLQEIFDTVAIHLIKQNARSRNPKDERMCMYRGEHGRKCAIGCLIPDEKYEDTMEGNSVSSIQGAINCGRVEYSPSWMNMLHDLQALHDLTPVAMWRSALCDVAAKYGLSDAVAQG